MGQKQSSTSNDNKQEPKDQYWEKDADHPQCQLCDVKFTVIRRRHHCRSCGGVFCAACSSRTATVPMRGFDNPVRVCDRCKLREGGVPNLPNAITGTSRSSTGAGTGYQRSKSMDVSSGGAGGVMGAGAQSEGALNMNYRSATPRAASSLAIIENSSRNNRATTPRLGGGQSSLAGRPPMPPVRGQFLSNNSNAGGAGGMPRTPRGGGGNNNSHDHSSSPSSAANNNNSNNNNQKTTPTPPRYISAVYQLMLLSPLFKNAPKDARDLIGKQLMGYLKQPSTWFDRACIQTHKTSILGDPFADWTMLRLCSRQPSGLSAGVAARNGTTGVSSTPQKAPALFLAAPTLPSTRATTLCLSLRLYQQQQQQQQNDANNNNTSSSALLHPLSLLRSLQIGVVHESSMMSSRTRALPTPAASFTVDGLSTARVPAVGVSFEGKSFFGNKVENVDHFRLGEGVTAVVVSVSFDQSSGSVAFSLMDATDSLVANNNGNNNNIININNNSRSPIQSSASIDNNNNKNQQQQQMFATLPVLAAFPCTLPSGVAGKWSTAFSLDTAQLEGNNLVAEWL